MAGQIFENTLETVERFAISKLPVLPEAFIGGARLTGRYSHPAFEDYLPAMEDHVLVAQLGGAGQVLSTTDSRRHAYTAMPGTISIVPRGYEGERIATDTMSVSNVILPLARISTTASQLGLNRTPDLVERNHHADEKLFTLLNLLRIEVELWEAASPLLIEQVVDMVCAHVLRTHSNAPLTPQHHVGSLTRRQITRVVDYMAENLSREVSLQELADLAGLSRFHFCSAFRRSTGHPPHRWLTRLRMEQARELLLKTELPVTHIALAVGYQTPSAFSAVFRRFHSVTPSGFRRLK